jgi:hypothetical protein
MRVVGAFYLLLFVMVAIVKKPISVEGPPGTLALADKGDALANFVIDTWVTLGTYLGAVGVALLLASRAAQQAIPLVWTVMGLDLAGIAIDFYKLSRGYPLPVSGPWIVIHSLIIVTGFLCLRRARTNTARA